MKFKEHAVSFFRKWIFPLSIGLFYTALFWIVWSLSHTLGIGVKDFAHMLSIGVSVFFIGLFLSPFRSKRLLLDIGRANILVLSILQIGMIPSSILSSEFPELMALWAQILLLAALGVTFYEEYRREEIFSHGFLLFGFVFGYLLLLELSLWITGFEDAAWVYCAVAFLWWSVVFEWVSSKIFRECRIFVRLFSILFVYAGTIGLTVLYAFWWVGHWVLILLLLAIFFNAYVHQKFQNYASLLLVLIVAVSIFERVLGISDSFLLTLITGWMLAFGLAFGSLIFKSSHSYDQYFFQWSAIVAAIGHFIAYSWEYGMMGTLNFSILLLFFSGLFFVSYLRIAK